jgi:hypothetical protein
MGHSCVAFSGKLYIFGGRTEKQFLEDILIIDTENGTYERIESVKGVPWPCQRAFHAAVLIASTGEFAITGGTSNKELLGDCWVFNIAERVWRQEPEAVAERRMFHRSYFWGQWIVLVGGATKKTSPGKENPLTLIDTKTRGEWKEGLFRQFGNLPFAFSSFAMVAIGPSTLLLFGGADPVTKVPCVTSYILDLIGGLIERRRTSLVL